MDKIDRISAHDIRTGTYIILDGIVCKVVSYTFAKTGKHGSSKMHLLTTEVISGKQKNGLIGSTTMVDSPIVTRTEYQLVGISEDGFLSLMGASGEIRQDIKNPSDEIGDKIQDLFETNDLDKDICIYIMGFLETELIVDAKLGN
jgi:translation initiation factor 5A